MEGRASSPVQPGSRARVNPELAEETPGAPSFSLSARLPARYFFGLKSRDAEFMQ